MNLQLYRENYTFKGKIKLFIWRCVNHTFFRFISPLLGRSFRSYFLMGFGARLDLPLQVYASSRIWAPWNLQMGEYSCIGPDTEIYNKAMIKIGRHSVVSQGAFLCTASHDITTQTHDLIIKPIIIGDKAWIAAKAFIGPGVTLGEGAVVGACAVVTKDVEPWTVVAGNPARFIKRRELKS